MTCFFIVDLEVKSYPWLIKNWTLQIKEREHIIDSIKGAGYDGFDVIEKGVKNLAIFYNGSIKGFIKIP